MSQPPAHSASTAPFVHTMACPSIPLHPVHFSEPFHPQGTLPMSQFYVVLVVIAERMKTQDASVCATKTREAH